MTEHEQYWRRRPARNDNGGTGVTAGSESELEEALAERRRLQDDVREGRRDMSEQEQRELAHEIEHLEGALDQGSTAEDAGIG